MDTSGTGILPEGDAHFPHEGRVPTRRRSDAAGEKGALGIVPDPLRPVGHTDFRNAQPLHGGGMEAVLISGNQANLFIQCHLLHQRGSALLMFGTNDGLCLKGKRSEDQQRKNQTFFHVVRIVQAKIINRQRIPYFFKIRSTGFLMLRAQRVYP